jgi:hypothetical protein
MVPVIPGILAPPMNFYYYGFQFLRFIQLYNALTFLKKLDGSFFVGTCCAISVCLYRA